MFQSRTMTFALLAFSATFWLTSQVEAQRPWNSRTRVNRIHRFIGVWVSDGYHLNTPGPSVGYYQPWSAHNTSSFSRYQKGDRNGAYGSGNFYGSTTGQDNSIRYFQFSQPNQAPPAPQSRIRYEFIPDPRNEYRKIPAPAAPKPPAPPKFDTSPQRELSKRIQKRDIPSKEEELLDALEIK